MFPGIDYCTLKFFYIKIMCNYFFLGYLVKERFLNELQIYENLFDKSMNIDGEEKIFQLFYC